MFLEAMRSLGKKPATVQYPFAPLKLANKYRGQLIFHPEKCVGCKLCMRDCPNNTIQINKIADKKFEATIDLGQCIYCGQCADSCNKKAIEMSDNVELAQLDNTKLHIVFNVKEEDAKPQEEPNPQTNPPKQTE